MVSRWLQSAISSLVAVPCLPVTGTFVIHVLSMHPMPPLNARPRVPLVASTTVLCPVLSCPVRACSRSSSCFPPTSRRSQLATSLPCLPRLHAQTSCYLSPASHHPHSLLFCPDAAVTAAPDFQRVTEPLRAHNDCTRPLDKSSLRPVTSTPALSSTTLKTVQSPSPRKAQRH